jgi:hypothetical protein
MTLAELSTLAFWNQLARSHLPELVMVLTAAVVVLLDRYLRPMVHKSLSAHHFIFRFLAFLVLCSVGYGVLALGVAWSVRTGLLLHKGQYMAPIAAGILLIVAIEANRQKQS